MSPITIRATLAFAAPANESGPDRSAMTPTLIGWPSGSGVAFPMISSLEWRGPVARRDRVQRVVVGRMLPSLRPPYIGSTPHLGRFAPPRRVRRHAGARTGQRVRTAPGVPAAVVSARVMDLRGR